MNDMGEKIAGAFLSGILNTIVSFWPFLLLLFVLSLAKPWLTRFLRSRVKNDGEARYVSREFLLSEAEKHFHQSLQAAVGHQYWIYPKVRLADIVEVDPDLNRSANQTAWNRISQKHVDFTLCDPGDFRIIAIVELDDSSHRLKDRQKRDGNVDAILNQIRIPVLHVRCARNYSREALVSQIEVLLNPKSCNSF